MKKNTLYIKNRLTFIVESVNSVNRGTFMITTQQEEILRILDLKLKINMKI